MTSPEIRETQLQTEVQEALSHSLGPSEMAGHESKTHPALAWAACGAMTLTGHANGPPRIAPADLANACARAVHALHRLSGTTATQTLDGAQLLGERAAIAGLQRDGDRSPGGSCRILRTADGWIAANLARPDDHSLLPAWLGEGSWAEPWRVLADRVREQPRDALVSRARLLGLAVAPLKQPTPFSPPWCAVAARGEIRPTPRDRPPRVLDLSALWAGPLCAHLLHLAGADVIKVESLQRPDGARFGPPRFFDLMNAGKRSVALDFSDRHDRAVLRRLIQTADIVVESARPRALQHFGIHAESLVRETPGLTWLGITGYGRQGPAAQWVAFGDDAAAAAGLATATAPDAPIFCGDAIADPLTGLYAAVACLLAWQQGGGVLLDVALTHVVAHILASDPCSPNMAEVRPANAASPDTWTVLTPAEEQAVCPPRARPENGCARPLGADTQAILMEAQKAC